MSAWPVLSTIVTWPVLGALVVGLLRWLEDARGKAWPRDLYPRLALFFAGTGFLMVLPVVLFFHTGYSGLQFEERVRWIPEWGVSYALGVDGLNVLLVGLTALLVPLAVLAAWQEVREHVAGFYAALLLLEAALLGVFLAADLLVFYVFWELVLVPMFFIVFVWGGPRRVEAAFKFLLYTLAGSLFMLAGIVYLYVQTGGQTLLYADVGRLLRTGRVLTPAEEAWLFWAFALAFAVKVPLVPLHMWLPAAHVEAPTAGSVLLAGVLLKMGTYGLLRFCVPWFPHAVRQFQPVLVGLGVLGVVYGAWAALAQTDMKRLVAYSSISHLGLIVAGIFTLDPTAVQGALLQMVNHGISTGGLFLLVGMLYVRRHTREMAEYGGLAAVMPRYAAVFLVVMLSSIGLPFLNGFVGEFLVFWGAFRRYPGAAALAVTGVIWSAVYMLRMYQRVMHGPVTRPENRGLADLSPREWAAVLPVLALAVLIGVWATPFLARTQTAVQWTLGNLGR